MSLTDQVATVGTINRDELKDKIERGQRFKLVEALPEEDFMEAHLPGALHLPPDQVRELAAQVLPDKDAEIVVYCTARAAMPQRRPPMSPRPWATPM